MKDFFGEKLFLTTDTALDLYKKVKALPIIDYHCHLDPALIAEDKTFSDIGEFWLSGDPTGTGASINTFAAIGQICTKVFPSFTFISFPSKS